MEYSLADQLSEELSELEESRANLEEITKGELAQNEIDFLGSLTDFISDSYDDEVWSALSLVDARFSNIVDVYLVVMNASW